MTSTLRGTLFIIATLFITTFSITSLSACSPDKPQGVLTDAQKKTLDKAKKTEEVLKKANEEQLKQAGEK